MTNPGQQRIELMRNDGQLRGGALYAFGPLALGAWLFGRGSLTSAKYLDKPGLLHVRWGVGAGVEAEWAALDWLLVYAEVVLDVATSQTEYFVNQSYVTTDPLLLLTGGAGLLIRGRL